MQANPGPKGETLIIEDDPGARAALADALTLAGYEVICFVDGDGLLAHARIRAPLCVFVDVGVSSKCRLGLLERICAESWRAPVFASSAEPSIPLAVDAVRKGAFDFIAKPFDVSDVVARVHNALREAGCSRQELPAKLWNNANLTGREWEVLERITLGESNKEIARRLGISSRTVEDYRANILRKAGVGNTTDLVRWTFGQTGRP